MSGPCVIRKQFSHGCDEKRVGENLCCFIAQVAKQWFDFDRNTFVFMKKVKSAAQVFTYTSDFDENGILYWIGTNARYANCVTTFEVIL